MLRAPAVPINNRIILLQTGQATAKSARVTPPIRREFCLSSVGGAWIANQVKVRATVAIITGYSHQRIGTSRAKIGLGIMSVGRPKNKRVKSAQPAATSRRCRRVFWLKFSALTYPVANPFGCGWLRISMVLSRWEVSLTG